MRTGGETRLRIGDYCEPKNFRRNGNFDDRFYTPFAFLTSSHPLASINDGMVAWPFVLPKATRFTRLGWYVGGISTTTYLRFAFYATDPLNRASFPFPGKLIWGMAAWWYLNSSGFITDGDYSPPVILPGNQLIWAVQAGYDTVGTPNGTVTTVPATDSNAGLSRVGVPNILGVAAAGDETAANCYWATALGDNYALPNPFPTANITLTARALPMFGFQLV